MNVNRAGSLAWKDARLAMPRHGIAGDPGFKSRPVHQ